MPLLIRLATITLSLLLVCAGVWIFIYLLPYVAPFLLALTLAVLVEPINTFLLKYTPMKRIHAVIISNTIFLVGIIGLFTFVGIEIVVQLIMLFKRLPENLLVIQNDALLLLDRLWSMFLDLPPEVVSAINANLNDIIRFAQSLFTNAATRLVGFLSSLPGFFVVLLIVMISFNLMSYGLPQIKRQFLNLFSEHAQHKVNLVLNDLNSALIGFVRAQFMLSSITYILSLSGLMILKVKYALAISLLIVLVDLLPIIGTGTFLIPWAIYSFLHGDQRVGLGLVLIFLVITIIRRIVEPKILGENIGLGPLATIISLYLGVTMLGAIGIFIGPIVFIVIQSIRKAGLLHFKIHF